MMKYGLLCLLIPCVVYACDPPFVAVGQGCYYYSADRGLIVDTYDAAVSVCQDDGGNLADVKTVEENTAIVDHFFGSAILEDKVLLNARLTDGQFVWLDGTPVANGFEGWQEDQPSGNGECMGYSDEHELQWDDFQCENFISSGLAVGFICEQPSDSSTTTSAPTTTTTVSHTCVVPFEPAGEGCYYYSEGDVIIDNYDSAEALCQVDGGYLAIVKTQEENTAIVEHFLGETIPDQKVLLGAKLNDDELFEWNDGTLVANGFDDWDEDQPSGNGECMGYSDEHEFEWDDFQCDSYIESGLAVGFICQSSPVSFTKNDQKDKIKGPKSYHFGKKGHNNAA